MNSGELIDFKVVNEGVKDQGMMVMVDENEYIEVNHKYNITGIVNTITYGIYLTNHLLSWNPNDLFFTFKTIDREKTEFNYDDPLLGACYQMKVFDVETTNRLKRICTRKTSDIYSVLWDKVDTIKDEIANKKKGSKDEYINLDEKFKDGPGNTFKRCV